MAIKYHENYPIDWPAIALAIKDANDWRCQNPECERQCTRPGEPYAGARNVLTVAHLDPDSYDQEFAQVAPLCAVCHLQMDAPFGAFFRRRHAVRRQRAAGQLTWSWAGAA